MYIIQGISQYVILLNFKKRLKERGWPWTEGLWSEVGICTSRNFLWVKPVPKKIELSWKNPTQEDSQAVWEDPDRKRVSG